MSPTNEVLTNKDEALQAGLDGLRRTVADLRRRRGELSGEHDQGRRRRDELHALLDSERANARVEGRDADTGEITTELEALAVDLGIPAQTVPPSQSNPGGSVITQGRPGALPLALRRLDSEIVQAEAAVASFIADHRLQFVEAAHERAAAADEARAVLVQAAEAVEAAEAAMSTAYGLAFSARTTGQTSAKRQVWGQFRPERPFGVPADMVDAPANWCAASAAATGPTRASSSSS